MKKIFTFLFCAVALAVSAQQVTITPMNGSVSGIIIDNDTDIVIDGVVKNNTDATLPLKWVRENVNTPNRWETAICDIETCWGYSTSTKDFDLPNALNLPNGGTLNVHFYPRNTAGTGSLQVAIYNRTTNTELGRNTYTATATAVGTSMVTKNNIKIFPNPATEYITISDNSDIKFVTFYSIIGTKVKEFMVRNENDKYDISELNRGIYMVQLSNKNRQTIKTIRISKVNP